MQVKLTSTQLSYLEWFYKGNKIEICLQALHLHYSTEPTFKTDIRALENLKKSGMLSTHPEFVYGLIFYVVTINDKGIQYLEERS